MTTPALSVVPPAAKAAVPPAPPAVQSSSGCKMWNNPTGWRKGVAHPKRRGLPGICVDQKPVQGSGLLRTHMPHGVEDETGDRPLAERAR